MEPWLIPLLLLLEEQFQTAKTAAAEHLDARLKPEAYTGQLQCFRMHD